MTLMYVSIAFAQEAATASASNIDQAITVTSALGPFATIAIALFWGAVTIGRVTERGLNIRVQVDLLHEDRRLIERGVVAIERAVERGDK